MKQETKLMIIAVLLLAGLMGLGLMLKADREKAHATKYCMNTLQSSNPNTPQFKQCVSNYLNY